MPASSQDTPARDLTVLKEQRMDVCVCDSVVCVTCSLTDTSSLSIRLSQGWNIVHLKAFHFSLGLCKTHYAKGLPSDQCKKRPGSLIEVLNPRSTTQALSKYDCDRELLTVEMYICMHCSKEDVAVP